jgi:hypothetical protein
MDLGPPALVISGLAELAQASEEEKMVIAQTLTVCSDVCAITIFSSSDACANSANPEITNAGGPAGMSIILNPFC